MSDPAAPRHRRDRHGRGPRGPLGPPGSALSRTRRARFTDDVLAAVRRARTRFPDQLIGLQVVVTEVPEPAGDAEPLALATVRACGAHGPARITVHRQAVALRATGPAELRRLVRDVVAESLAELLGRDPREIDPSYLPPED